MIRTALPYRETSVHVSQRTCKNTQISDTATKKVNIILLQRDSKLSIQRTVKGLIVIIKMRKNSKKASSVKDASCYEKKFYLSKSVICGRFELPTSCLSSKRSKPTELADRHYFYSCRTLFADINEKRCGKIGCKSTNFF